MIRLLRKVLKNEFQNIGTAKEICQKPTKKIKRDSESGSFWEFVIYKQGIKSNVNSDSEVDGYLAEPCISPNWDILHYWRCHEEQYPVLQQLSRKYLSMQCNSVPSERHFSTAGQLV